MKIVVSACLLGENCKYNGGNNLCPAVVAFTAGKDVIPVCPERAAGLGCPRVPMEIVNAVLINKDGVNVDEPVRSAVARLMAQLQPDEIQCAVLKARSPTCGVHQVYDGSFTGKLVEGSGVFAQALQAAGIRVLDESQIE